MLALVGHDPFSKKKLSYFLHTALGGLILLAYENFLASSPQITEGAWAKWGSTINECAVPSSLSRIL